MEMIPLRSMLIFSTEFVLGPAIAGNQYLTVAGLEHCSHTNGTDDGSPAVVLGRHHVGVKFGVPLHLHTVAEMVKWSSHVDEQFCSARRRSERGKEKSHTGGLSEMIKEERQAN
jgi:hypothetical protein